MAKERNPFATTLLSASGSRFLMPYLPSLRCSQGQQSPEKQVQASDPGLETSLKELLRNTKLINTLMKR